MARHAYKWLLTPELEGRLRGYYGVQVKPSFVEIGAVMGVPANVVQHWLVKLGLHTPRPRTLRSATVTQPRKVSAVSAAPSPPPPAPPVEQAPTHYTCANPQCGQTCPASFFPMVARLDGAGWERRKLCPDCHRAENQDRVARGAGLSWQAAAREAAKATPLAAPRPLAAPAAPAAPPPPPAAPTPVPAIDLTQVRALVSQEVTREVTREVTSQLQGAIAQQVKLQVRAALRQGIHQGSREVLRTLALSLADVVAELVAQSLLSADPTREKESA